MQYNELLLGSENKHIYTLKASNAHLLLIAFLRVHCDSSSKSIARVFSQSMYYDGSSSPVAVAQGCFHW